MSKLFSKRSILGTFLLLILVGEPTVAMVSGLFTPQGFSALFVLYFCLYHIYEALIIRYKLVAWQMVFLNFGIYAVLVTGLLHAELADYVLKPQDHIITTLIRIQCSLFPIFAFYLLNRWMPRQSDQALSWRASWGLFAGFSLAFTAFTLSVPSIKGFGWLTAASTIQAAPVFSLFFIVLAVALAVTALRRRASGTTYSSQRFTIFSLGCLLLGATPSLGFFIVLLIIMPLGLAWFWREPALRSAKL